jgi:hypothetical protein
MDHRVRGEFADRESHVLDQVRQTVVQQMPPHKLRCPLSAKTFVIVGEVWATGNLLSRLRPQKAI